MKLLLILLTCLAFQGCLYTNIHSPRAYRSATPSDVKASATDELVSGEACNQFLLYLVGWGNAGYAAATAKALAGKTDAMLYDVRTDIKIDSHLLGLYTRTCTIVTGRVGRP